MQPPMSETPDRENEALEIATVAQHAAPLIAALLNVALLWAVLEGMQLLPAFPDRGWAKTTRVYGQHPAPSRERQPT